MRVRMAVGILLDLGANVGDPLAQLTLASERLARTGSIVAVSSVYRSAPVGYRHQPDFHNLVLSARTQLSPEELLTGIHEIEHAPGPVYAAGPGWTRAARGERPVPPGAA